MPTLGENLDMTNLQAVPAIQPDPAIECEIALEDSFSALAHKGESAGWTSDTVVLALFSLAMNRLQLLNETAGDEALSAETLSALRAAVAAIKK